MEYWWYVHRLVLITSQDGLVFGQNIMWTGYECWAESEYMFSDGSVVCAASVDRYRKTHIIDTIDARQVRDPFTSFTYDFHTFSFFEIIFKVVDMPSNLQERDFVGTPYVPVMFCFLSNLVILAVFPTGEDKIRHYLATRNVKGFDLPSFVRDVCSLTPTVLGLACWSKSALQRLRLTEALEPTRGIKGLFKGKFQYMHPGKDTMELRSSIPSCLYGCIQKNTWQDHTNAR
ncbi:hypothetical protein Tco_0717787 [Tanacetum coccineum]